MDLREMYRGERRYAFATAIALAIAIFTIGSPVVEAAVSRVRLDGGTANVRIRSSAGDPIQSKPTRGFGILAGTGSTGAVAIRNYAGGGGILGAGDCTASTEPAQGPLANTVSISGADIITGVLVTGTGTVRLTSGVVGQGQIPIANFTVNADEPNEFVGFDNGLTATSEMRFTGIDGTACNFVVFGQG